MSTRHIAPLPSVVRNAVVEPIPRVLPRALPRLQSQTGTLAHTPAHPSAGRTADEGLLGELRQRAQELGYEEGLRQGLAQAEQRLAAAQRDLQARAEQDMEALRRRLADSQQQEVARLKELATSLQDVLAAHLAALEKKAAQLAFAAVCKILCAPQERAQVLQAVVEGQLASFRQQGRLTVRLNPSDHQLIEASAQASAAWQWVADPRLRPGDCVIDQAAGQVDLGLDTQLTRLRDTWLMALAAEALPATDAAAVDSVALTGHR